MRAIGNDLPSIAIDPGEVDRAASPARTRNRRLAAFENPDGTIGVFAARPGTPRTIRIDVILGVTRTASVQATIGLGELLAVRWSPAA